LKNAQKGDWGSKEWNTQMRKANNLTGGEEKEGVWLNLKVGSWRRREKSERWNHKSEELKRT